MRIVEEFSRLLFLSFCVQCQLVRESLCLDKGVSEIVLLETSGQHDHDMMDDTVDCARVRDMVDSIISWVT